MSEQLTLPYSGRSNATRERSRRAAERAVKTANKKQRELLRWLADRGDYGGTDNERIACLVAAGLNANGVRARRGECEDYGWVEMLEQGRDGCTVWVITPAGRGQIGDVR